jgi:prephenate dehydrogenase
MNALLDAQISGVDCLAYAGSAFNGLTRVAASPVEMWRDICTSNRDALLVAIDEFEKALTHLKTCVAKGDSAELATAINRARAERQRLTKMREQS